MTTIGTPGTPSATRIMLLGSGELGRELCIELKRLGCEVMACDSYLGAPAMQVADHARVFSMLDGDTLRQQVMDFRPHLIVPEVEAIATHTLLALEQEGHCVVPSAKATYLTMNREGIRRLVAEDLQLPTSGYRFADTEQQAQQALAELGCPALMKPVMSSSGKGQSLLREVDQLSAAWRYAQEGGRAGAGRVILESFVDFDYEITLLTLVTKDGVQFCAPIGHTQEDGDYRQSWQPQPMSPLALERAQQMAAKVVMALGGQGIFGVELFVKGDQVIFSELSPRPHDTGMVTLISQNLSQFALHARAMLGLPVPLIRQYGPAASAALLVQGQSLAPVYTQLAQALTQADTDLRLFAKPEVKGQRRMGVGLALGQDLAEARNKAQTVVDSINVLL